MSELWYERVEALTDLNKPIEEIIQGLWEEGLTVEEIADYLAMTPKQVRGVLDS